MPHDLQLPTTSQTTTSAQTVRDLRRMIADLTGRIERQEKRVQKILVNRGSADELQTLLADMFKSRDMMQAQLEEFEKEARE